MFFENETSINATTLQSSPFGVVLLPATSIATLGFSEPRFP
jgi:hypothetical protein